LARTVLRLERVTEHLPQRWTAGSDALCALLDVRLERSSVGVEVALVVEDLRSIEATLRQAASASVACHVSWDRPPNSPRDTCSMRRPEVRYANSGGVRIAYQVFGEGPFDIVVAPSLVTHVELQWKVRQWAEFNERLGRLGRVIVFDKRGTGMSDRTVGIPDIEARMDDIRAVMDAAGSERAALIGMSDGGTMCALFAATYPDRCWALILWGSMPRYHFAPDYRGGLTEEEQRAEQAYGLEHPWGEMRGLEEFAEWLLPGAHTIDRQAIINVYLAGADAASYRALDEMNHAMDIRAALPAISAPTLIIYRAKEPSPITHGSRVFAELIPNATLVELPGAGHFPFGSDSARAFAHIEEFLRRSWKGAASTPDFDRVLATILFTDVVESTKKAVQLGDRAWRALLERHHATIRLLLARYRGVELDTAGDGFFARFDGPARGIRCAEAITASVRELGIDVRAGLHTGECEVIDGKVGGIAVHIGARIASRAGPGEVLVSQTVRDLVAGSDIGFEDRGTAQLKGIPGKWRLFQVIEMTI
jgi:class 3 adenylate cyclase/pimeloyl-ACP methyl ester carboxylesterase